MNLESLLPVALALILSPLLAGIINKTKAFFAGRNGVPVLQLYYDLGKLLRKGAVYSQTTSWIFRAGPIVTLSAVLVCLLIAPLGNCLGLINFSGDLVVFFYLLALARFFTVAAAMDTGSSFER